MTIRICKVPPSAFLEGIDLRSYRFQVGERYEVPQPVAHVLIDWGYAEDESPDTRTE